MVADFFSLFLLAIVSAAVTAILVVSARQRGRRDRTERDQDAEPAITSPDNTMQSADAKVNAKIVLPAVCAFVLSFTLPLLCVWAVLVSGESAEMLGQGRRVVWGIGAAFTAPLLIGFARLAMCRRAVEEDSADRQ